MASTRRPTRRSLALVVSTICALVALFGLTANAGAVTRSGGTGTDPWIASELPDYAPGSTVNLLGGSWQPGEAVHIYVNDSDGQTWVFNDDVIADANGDISDSFNLPSWFVANYSVTATGASGAVATTTFTDAIQTTTILASGLNPANLADSITFTATITCAQACTFGGQSVDFVENANQNCNGGTTLGSTSTLTGSGSFTRQATFTTSTLSGGTHSIRACFNGGGPNTTPGSSASAPLSQVVNACTSPAVTTQPASQSVAYPANATFSAAASGTSPSVQWQVNAGSGFTNISGANSTTLSLTKPSVLSTGNQYRAVFSNGCGSAITNAVTLTVAAKALTVTGITASSKVYDGSTSATINTSSAALTGVVSGDSVSLNTATASGAFLTKTVGTGKTVQISGLTISGADAGDYSLTQPTTTANISAKALSGSFTANNKVYDGSRTATVATKSLPGVVGSDDATLVVSNPLFDTKNVGTGKDVAGALSLSGADAGNYSVNASYTAKGDITAAGLTVSGITANSKVFDSGTAASLNLGGAALVGVISPDAVTLNTGAAVGTFAGSAVGTWTVTVSGLTISGSDSGNYSLTQPTTTASILPWNANGKGFYAPVGADPGHSIFTPAPGITPTIKPSTMDWNSAKGGSTVPLKFNIFAGALEKTTADAFPGANLATAFSAAKLNVCTDATSEDPIDFTTTGSTSLRYDGTGGQWIQNWKTPNVTGDSCYRAWVTFADGSTLEAFFKLKK